MEILSSKPSYTVSSHNWILLSSTPLSSFAVQFVASVSASLSSATFSRIMKLSVWYASFIFG